MNHIINFIQEILLILENNIYLLYIITTIACCTIGFIIITYINKILRSLKNSLHSKSFTAKRYQWYYKILIAAEKPLKFTVLLSLLRVWLYFISDSIGNDVVAFFSTIKNIAFMLIFTWFLLNFINQIELDLYSSKKNTNDNEKINIDFITKILRVIVIISAGLFTMQILGISVNGLLAFGGASGIAVGFAAKDMLANIFGTVLVYFDQPFAIGDNIKIINSNVDGAVETIGWRITTIRTKDKKLIYVPNSIFSTSAIENGSKISHKRIKENILIRAQDQQYIGAIVDDIRENLLTNPDIDKTCDVIAHFNAATTEGLNISIECFTNETRQVQFSIIKQKIMLKICEIISSHGAQLMICKK